MKLKFGNWQIEVNEPRIFDLVIKISSMGHRNLAVSAYIQILLQTVSCYSHTSKKIFITKF